MLRLSGRAEIADIVRDISEGVIRHISVGYSVAEWRDGTNQGTRTRTAVKWSPREVSFVAIPADRNAHTRNFKMNELTNSNATAERNRAIRELAQRAGVASTVADDLIDREAGIDEARAAVLDDIIKRGTVNIRTAAPHNANTLDNPEALVRAAGDALYVRVDPAHKPADASRQFVGLSIPEIAKDILRRAGISTTSMSADTVITRALHTTSDFPLILADTVNRTLRASYTAAPGGIRQLARRVRAQGHAACSGAQAQRRGRGRDAQSAIHGQDERPAARHPLSRGAFGRSQAACR
jgi:hypothetical protein